MEKYENIQMVDPLVPLKFQSVGNGVPSLTLLPLSSPGICMDALLSPLVHLGITNPLVWSDIHVGGRFWPTTTGKTGLRWVKVEGGICRIYEYVRHCISV